jgi:hypothetical protein
MRTYLPNFVYSSRRVIPFVSERRWNSAQQDVRFMARPKDASSGMVQKTVFCTLASESMARRNVLQWSSSAPQCNTRLRARRTSCTIHRRLNQGLPYIKSSLQLSRAFETRSTSAGEFDVCGTKCILKLSSVFSSSSGAASCLKQRMADLDSGVAPPSQPSTFCAFL